MDRRIGRRRFLETAGRLGAGAVLGSLPLLNGCKGGPTTPDEPPEPAVPVDLEFTVYNHTQGPRGSFRRTGVMSGTTLELSVPALISELGISDVYDKAIVIRETESGTRVGVSRDSNKGSFLVPKKNTSYQIFLFNIDGALIYASGYRNRWLPSVPPFGTHIRAYRADFNGLTGEERIWGGEIVPETGGFGALDQLNEALKPDWESWSYGHIERNPTPNNGTGDFCYGFADCRGYDSQVWLPGVISPTDYFCGIDPRRVPDLKTQVGHGLVTAMILVTGVVFSPLGDPFQVLQEEGRLKPAARDFLSFWFLVM